MRLGERPALSNLHRQRRARRASGRIGQRVFLAHDRQQPPVEGVVGVAHGAGLLGVALDLEQPLLLAALTVASLTRQRATFVDDTLPALQRCAEAIGRAAGIV